MLTLVSEVSYRTFPPEELGIREIGDFLSCRRRARETYRQDTDLLFSLASSLFLSGRDSKLTRRKRAKQKRT